MRQKVLDRPKCLVLPCSSLLISLALACSTIYSTDVDISDKSRQKVQTKSYADTAIFTFVRVPLTSTVEFTAVLQEAPVLSSNRCSVIITCSTISQDAKQRFSDSVIGAQETQVWFQYDIF